MKSFPLREKAFSTVVFKVSEGFCKVVCFLREKADGKVAVVEGFGKAFVKVSVLKRKTSFEKGFLLRKGLFAKAFVKAFVEGLFEEKRHD